MHKRLAADWRKLAGMHVYAFSVVAMIISPASRVNEVFCSSRWKNISTYRHGVNICVSVHQDLAFLRDLSSFLVSYTIRRTHEEQA